MKILALLICVLTTSEGTINPAYNPVFEYDVPLARPQIVYPSVHAQVGVPVYGSGYSSAYGYGYGAPVSHSYQHSQTHPVSYLRPVSARTNFFKKNLSK